jgi:hypothetical protein
MIDKKRQPDCVSTLVEAVDKFELRVKELEEDPFLRKELVEDVVNRVVIDCKSIKRREER